MVYEKTIKIKNEYLVKVLKRLDYNYSEFMKALKGRFDEYETQPMMMSDDILFWQNENKVKFESLKEYKKHSTVVFTLEF